MGMPYRHILMLVDGSFNAEAAGRYALLLAQACEARLLLLGVVEGTGPPSEAIGIEASLERLAGQGRERGVAVEPYLRRGEFIAVVRELTTRQGVDAVLAAARHADARRRFFVATAGSRLMAALDLSVIVVRVVNPGRLGRPHRFLVPLRGGDARWFPEKAYLVGRLARACQARVEILHVRRVRKRYFPWAVGLAPGTLESAADRQVGGFEDLLKTQGVTPGRRVVAAPAVAPAILTEAAAHHHDLIIAGATAQDWRARLLSESPIETLMSQTLCDLMVLRPGR